MPYHCRIESKNIASLVTIRSRNSELWFVNNHALQESILGYAAKYSSVHKIKLFAFGIEGNHLHHVAKYPNANRSDFTRDLHSNVARAVQRFTPEYPGGRLFGRRYSGEFLPGEDDIEEYFFYTVLQPIQDGLVQTITEYPFYNCFHDAIYGIKRRFKVTNWTAYNTAKRYNPYVRISDYNEFIELEYQRLPGYEDLTKSEYVKMMLAKLEVRRREIVAKRFAQGKSFLGREALLRIARGANPRTTKTSTRYSYRPRVLSVCPTRRRQYLEWYFSMYKAFKEASQRYRCGDLLAVFPKGMFRPYLKTAPPLADSLVPGQ